MGTPFSLRQHEHRAGVGLSGSPGHGSADLDGRSIVEHQCIVNLWEKNIGLPINHRINERGANKPFDNDAWAKAPGGKDRF